MKDLIAKLQMDANCAMGAIWMHIEAQAARIAELEAQIAAASALAAEQQNDLIRVYDAFGFHPEGRKIGVLMTNIENVIRFANMLHAIEREFFMVAGDPEDYEPGEEIEEICAVNCWGSTLPEYVEQFRGALAVKAKDACAEERRSWDLTCSEQAMEIEYLKEQQAVAPQAADTDKLRETIADELHNAIMNLRCSVPRAVSMHGATEQAYKEGHRDARHAAAELIASTALQAPVREVPGWQPIETAPKDGSHILCYAPELQFVGFYGDPINKWCYMAPGVPIAPTQPTHWCALPAAPVQQEGE